MSRATAIDPDDDVVIVGDLVFATDFGGGAVTSAGLDAFLAKYTPSGQHLWSKQFGAPGTTVYAYGVATDSQGNIIVVGVLNGTVDFGGGALSSDQSGDVFIAKFMPGGAHRWSKSYGGTGYPSVAAVTVGESDHILITGVLSGSASFGGAMLTSAGSSDVIVAKYSPTGEHVWSKRLGGTSRDVSRAIALDGQDNVLVAGRFEGTADFAGPSLTSAGSADIFLVKLSPNGLPVWSKRLGGVRWDEPFGVGVGAEENIAMTGYFDGSVDFCGGPLAETGGVKDIFVKPLRDGRPSMRSARWGTEVQRLWTGSCHRQRGERADDRRVRRYDRFRWRDVHKSGWTRLIPR